MPNPPWRLHPGLLAIVAIAFGVVVSLTIIEVLDLNPCGKYQVTPCSAAHTLVMLLISVGLVFGLIALGSAAHRRGWIEISAHRKR
jgi:hypothetical protein